MTTRYICNGSKPLYPQASDYVLNYNADGNIIMGDGCVCSDLNSDNAGVTDVDLTTAGEFIEGIDSYDPIKKEFYIKKESNTIVL